MHWVLSVQPSLRQKTGLAGSIYFIAFLYGAKKTGQEMGFFYLEPEYFHMAESDTIPAYVSIPFSVYRINFFLTTDARIDDTLQDPSCSGNLRTMADGFKTVADRKKISQLF
jgi:hypothetical protein